MTKNLNRALHDCILRPPAVLTDTVKCQEEIPDITNREIYPVFCSARDGISYCEITETIESFMEDQKLQARP